MAKKTRKRPAIRASEGSLGKAKRARKSGVRARAKAADLLGADELEARQEKIGTKRRAGGPKLDEKPKGKVSAPKVAETEADKPLGMKKRARPRRND